LNFPYSVDSNKHLPVYYLYYTDYTSCQGDGVSKGDKSTVFSGARLQRCREMRYGPGPTTQELAHDAIVTFAYIRKLEKLKNLKPQAESLQKICDALGITIADLYIEPDAADPLANLPIIQPKRGPGQPRRAPSPAPLISSGNRDSLISQIVTSLPNLEDDLLGRLIEEINLHIG